MATKTVVCPECGSEAERGRYACSDCGALLAAVTVAPRADGSALGTDLNARIATLDQVAAAVALSSDRDDETGPQAAPAPTPAALAEVSTEVSTNDLHQTDIDPIKPAAGPASQPVGTMAFDENAPLASARSSSGPDVLHDLADTGEIDDAPAVAPAVSWPPPGDRGPIAAAEPRTPAGAYLPPSAVLPPLDLPATAAGDVPATPEPGSAVGTWASRSAAALTDALESVHLTADLSRRVVATGAGLGVLGLLLPWVNTLPGANPLAGYLDRWGLAGPGLWLVFIGLLVLTAIAGSSGRTASWPVGLAAVATGAFLVGLVWPYVMGGFGRSIGVGVVLVAAVVLVAGGLLDRRGRHDRGDAIV